MLDVNGQIALVTGASRGIGKATALLMAKAGADIVINYRTEAAAAEQVRQACEQLGRRAIAIQADVSVEDDVNAMLRQTMERFGRVDILVNNAGIWEHNPIDGLTTERLRRTLESNLTGVFHTCRAVVPIMKAQGGGVIINVSSTAGQRGEAYYSPYAASKSAIIGLTKSLAVELAPDNIRVNCVAPGWVETDMSRDALSGPGANQILSQIPLGRAGRPDELAGPILFLASGLASFITGEVLNVNGGAVLCG